MIERYLFVFFLFFFAFRNLTSVLLSIIWTRCLAWADWLRARKRHWRSWCAQSLKRRFPLQRWHPHLIFCKFYRLYANACVRLFVCLCGCVCMRQCVHWARKRVCSWYAQKFEKVLSHIAEMGTTFCTCALPSRDSPHIWSCLMRNSVSFWLLFPPFVIFNVVLF